MAAKAAIEMTSSAMPAASQVQRRWASTLSDPATSELSAAAAADKEPDGHDRDGSRDHHS